MTPDQQFKSGMQRLMEMPEFRRFLWRVIQVSGLLARTTDGSAERLGRRNLGLDILDMAEKGQPSQLTHPDGALLTLIQVLREETQKPIAEKPNARPRRTDEIFDHADADQDDDA